MTKTDQLIEYARACGASDLHLHPGMPPVVRLGGQLLPVPGEAALEDEALLKDFKEMLGSKSGSDPRREDVDFGYETAGGKRHRINLYRQSGRVCAAVRILNDRIPTIEELMLPGILHQFVKEPRGLVLVTGPTGSGKSTTLAAMIDEINRTRHCHILTLEDPVEYRYEAKHSLISQREIGADAPDFESGLRSALREDPDVILVGEMRDLKTMEAALTAAETGHLVFATLHTIGAANTVDRMIDVFPAGQQQQVRVQLASVLRGIITQQLLPGGEGRGRAAATEILVVTDAVSNLIREKKLHQIGSLIETGTAFGMHTLNASLAKLVRDGRIAVETAMLASDDKEGLKRMLL